MLRRFDQFQWGPLNAQRLNQLVDAVTRLQQQVQAIPSGIGRPKDRIMVRIESDPVKFGERDCADGVIGVSYPFTQVEMAMPDQGDVTERSCLQVTVPADAIASTKGHVLVVIENAPSLEKGDIIPADRAPLSFAAAADKQVMYIGQGKTAPQIVVCEVLGGGPEYDCVIPESGAQIAVENLYETAGYYGALDEQPECAALLPLSIPDGSRIWAFKYAQQWYTMTPTAFSVSCTCNDTTTPEGMMRVQQALEAKAAAAMLDIQRGLI